MGSLPRVREEGDRTMPSGWVEDGLGALLPDETISSRVEGPGALGHGSKMYIYRFTYL